MYCKSYCRETADSPHGRTCGFIGPVATMQLEETMFELKEDYSIIIVTHNMQQAARASDYTAFFYLGDLIEYDETKKIFQDAALQSTNDYVSGRFG